MSDIENKIQERKNRRTKLAAFIRTLEKQERLNTVFDERLWNATAETVTVYSRERMAFVFRGGVIRSRITKRTFTAMPPRLICFACETQPPRS